MKKNTVAIRDGTKEEDLLKEITELDSILIGLQNQMSELEKLKSNLKKLIKKKDEELKNIETGNMKIFEEKRKSKKMKNPVKIAQNRYSPQQTTEVLDVIETSEDIESLKKKLKSKNLPYYKGSIQHLLLERDIPKGWGRDINKTLKKKDKYDKLFGRYDYEFKILQKDAETDDDEF